ncbi:MAG: hypothetical protein KBT19_03675 [Lachnospiraceae bacterium]|nr:hypothetical protein [Candidatus Colinaster equi]
MRIWIKEFLDNRMLKDTVIETPEADTRTHKVTRSLEAACHQFDLCTPIWLEKNIREFQTNSRTRFYQDSFIESIDFDYLDFQVIEED